MEPYTTTVLKQIKDKSDGLKLWDVEDALSSLKGYYKNKFFSYIVESNSKGNLPAYNDLRNHFHVSSSNVSLNIISLIDNGMIINPSIIEIVGVLGYQKKCVWKLPSTLEKRLPRFKEISGKLGRSISWEEKFKNSRARNYERYIIALAKENEMPVYSKIFYE